MKFNLYAIYDSLAGTYSNPFALDRRVAMRTFNFMTKERSEMDCKDRKVVLLGEYDNETGEILSEPGLNPEMVFDMEEAKKEMAE